MKKLSFFIAIIIFTSVAFAQKIDKNQVPQVVKTMLFTKASDTLLPTWEKSGEIYKASFTKGELAAEIEIKQTGEWLKTVWIMPYKYVPQKIKDNVIANYPSYKVMKSSIQYRTDADYYVIETKKKKDIKVLLFSLKSEFVKVDSDLISPIPIPKP